jgi:hypothetical protein
MHTVGSSAQYFSWFGNVRIRRPVRIIFLSAVEYGRSTTPSTLHSSPLLTQVSQGENSHEIPQGKSNKSGLSQAKWPMKRLSMCKDGYHHSAIFLVFFFFPSRVLFEWRRQILSLGKNSPRAEFHDQIAIAARNVGRDEGLDESVRTTQKAAVIEDRRIFLCTHNPIKRIKTISQRKK